LAPLFLFALTNNQQRTTKNRSYYELYGMTDFFYFGSSWRGSDGSKQRSAISGFTAFKRSAVLPSEQRSFWRSEHLDNALSRLLFSEAALQSEKRFFNRKTALWRAILHRRNLGYVVPYDELYDHYPWSVNPETFESDFNLREVFSECYKLRSTVRIEKYGVFTEQTAYPWTKYIAGRRSHLNQ